MTLTRKNPPIARRVLVVTMDKMRLPRLENEDKVDTKRIRMIGADAQGNPVSFPCSLPAVQQALGKMPGKAPREPFHLYPEDIRFVVCLDKEGAVVRTDTIKEIEPGRLERTKGVKTIDVRVSGDELGTLHVEAYPMRLGFDLIQTTLARMSLLEKFETGDTVGSTSVSSIDGDLVHLTVATAE